MQAASPAAPTTYAAFMPPNFHVSHRFPSHSQINGMLLVHLPDGPTAHFRLSNLTLGKDIKVSCQNACTANTGLIAHLDVRWPLNGRWGETSG